MSQENVELHYRCLDTVNRRNLGVLLALMDDDVEANSRIVAMEGGLHGHDGMRRWWENWLDAFPDYNIEVFEVRDLGDVTVAAVRTSHHGVGSELPFEEAIRHASPVAAREVRLVAQLLHARGSPQSRGAVGARRSHRLIFYGP
jgi:hypothetical protein